MPNIFGCYVQK